MRTAITLFFCLFSLSYMQAQKDTSAIQHEKGINIVVIPFEPNEYFNDGDQFICQNNNITPAQLDGVIRRSLEKILVEDLSVNYKSRKISDTVHSNSKSDLDMIYAHTSYTLEDKPLKGYSSNVDNNGIKSILGFGGRKKTDDYVSNTKDVKRKHRYFKATLVSDSSTGAMTKRYNENYYLFISHFEMETRYKDCHDMANNAFQRDMYVHYSLIDSKNNYVDGGVVCVTFQSSDREINNILEKNFNIISNMIIDQIKTKI